MATIYGTTSADAQGPSNSYKNTTAQVLNIVAGSSTYTVEPFAIVSIDVNDAAISTQLTKYVNNGTLIPITLYGTDLEPIVGTTATFNPTSSSTSSPTGLSFLGVSTDSDGYWILPDGNTLIYPANKNYQHIPQGPDSIITYSATMRRSDVTIGNLGFAVYTDATYQTTTFQNGYLVYWNFDGTGSVFKVVKGVQTLLPLSQVLPGTIDTNYHNFGVVVKQVNAGEMEFFLYTDGILVAQAIDLNNGFVNGAVGFSTSQGAKKVFVQPNSFEVAIGAIAFLSLPSSVQNAIALIQENSTALMAASATNVKNLVPDSGFIFTPGVYWNYSFGGTMSAQPSVGVDGGNALVWTSAGSSPGAIFAYSAVPINLKGGVQYCLSTNVKGSFITAGSAQVQLWAIAGGVPTGGALASVSQPAAGNGIVQVVYTPPGTSVGTYCLVFSFAGGTSVTSGQSVIFSVPQLEVGNTRSKYIQTMVADSQLTLPHLIHSTAVTTTIAATPGVDSIYLNSGQVNTRHINPGQVTLEHLIGDTSGDTTTNIIDGGNKRGLHTFMSTGTQTAVNSSGQGLLNEFPGTFLNTDGSISGFSSSGILTSRSFGTVTAGEILHVHCSFTPDSLTTQFRLFIGNSTNGYGITWDGSGDNLVKLAKIVGGTSTSLATLATYAQTTDLHSVSVTVNVIGASSNTIEVSADGHASNIIADTALDFTSSTWPVMIQTDSGCKITAFHYTRALSHHSMMSTGTKTAISQAGKGLLNEFTGPVLNSDGTLSGFSSAGISSIVSRALPSGTTVHLKGSFQLASTTETGIILGNKTSGYALRWTTGGAVQYGSFTSSVFTSLGTLTTLTQDTDSHSFAMTIITGATNSVEASFDGNIALATSDATITLTTGTWPATIYSAATTLCLDYVYDKELPHHTHHSKQTQAVIGGVIGGDGLYMTTGQVNSRHINSNQINQGHLEGSTSTSPTIASHSIILTPEGAASVTAAVTVTLAGVALDTSIQSFDLTWSAAASGQWHPPHEAVKAPSSLTFTGYVHGLAAGQSYDVGVQIRGINHVSYPSSPLVVGTSPSITGASIAAALAANSVAWKHLLGDLSGDITTPIADTGNKRLLHGGMSTGTQGAIDISGNLLNVEFPGTKIGADGALSGFNTGAGVTSSRSFPAFNVGDVITLHAVITPDNTTNLFKLLLGTTTGNAYGLSWDGTSDNLVKVAKYVGGVNSSLGTIATYPQTTDSHSVRFSTTVLAASSNTIEVSVDNNVGFIVGNVAIDLTQAGTTWPITVLADSGLKITSFHYTKALHHHAEMSTGVKTAINSSGQGLLNEFPNLTLNTDGTLTGFSAAGVSSTITRALPNGTTAHLEASLQTATLAETGIILGNKTLGYAVRWGTGGAIQYGTWLTSTFTSLGTIATITPDTNSHTYSLTVVSGGGGANSIEASFDGNIALNTSNSTVALVGSGWGGTVYSAATTKLIDYAYTVKQPHHTHHSKQTQSTIAGLAGGDGIFLQSGTITARHHLGELNGETTNVWDGSGKAYLHNRMSTPVQSTHVLTSPGDSHLASGIVTARHHAGELFGDITNVWDGSGRAYLHNRMSTPVQSTHVLTSPGDSHLASGIITARHHAGELLGDTTNVWDGSGRGAFLHNRMSTGVKIATNAFPDTFGSTVVGGQIHRLHLAQSGQPGATNHLINPTFAHGTVGWTGPTQNGGTATWTWTTDSYGGGRLVASPLSSSSSGSQFYSQQVTGLFTGFPYVIAGNIVMFNTSGTAGADVQIQVTGTPSNNIYAQLTLSATGGPQDFAKAFTLTSGDTSVVVYVIVYNGSGGGGGNVTATFAKLQLEAGTTPSPYVDHYTAKLVNTTHILTGGTGLDGILDGSSYARIVAADQTSNRIKQHLSNVFGGNVQTNNDSSMGGASGGFSVGLNSTAFMLNLPSNGALYASAQIKKGTAGESVGLMLGTTAAGVELLWRGTASISGISGGTSTDIYVVQWLSGTGTITSILPYTTGSSQADDTTMYHDFRIAISFNSVANIAGVGAPASSQVEAEFDVGTALFLPQSMNSGISSALFGSQVPMQIRTTGGNASVLQPSLRPRDSFLAASLPYQIIANQNLLPSGSNWGNGGSVGQSYASYMSLEATSILNKGIIDNQAIAAGAIQGSGSGTNVILAGSIGAADIAGLTGSGSVNLDKVPDGSTYARVNASTLTTGTVSQIAGGTSGTQVGIQGSIYSGAGAAPAFTAVKGSIFLRSGGSGANTSLYVNTTGGSGGWVAVG